MAITILISFEYLYIFFVEIVRFHEEELNCIRTFNQYPTAVVKQCPRNTYATKLSDIGLHTSLLYYRNKSFQKSYFIYYSTNIIYIACGCRREGHPVEPIKRNHDAYQIILTHGSYIFILCLKSKHMEDTVLKEVHKCYSVFQIGTITNS